jgi:intracellular septation protein A
MHLPPLATAPRRPGLPPMKLWTYRRPFVVNGQSFLVCIDAGLSHLRSVLLRDGQAVAQDETRLSGALADHRNHRLQTVLPGGALLEVESGYAGWWTTAIAVRVDGVLVHESHPGRTIAWPMRADKGPVTPEARQRLQEQDERDRAQWVRNKPSLIVDIALGLLFFVVSKATGNLTTAALVGAAAGLAIVVVQRFVKIDLLGGLALFGVCTLLLSAGFSLVFQDERMVQLKGSILGTLVAVVILVDALANRGRYFGARIARYVIGMAVDPQRLAIGVAVMGLTMAGLNLLATHLLSKDNWLIYTTFIDAPLAVLLMAGVFRFARSR